MTSEVLQDDRLPKKPSAQERIRHFLDVLETARKNIGAETEALVVIVTAGTPGADEVRSLVLTSGDIRAIAGSVASAHRSLHTHYVPAQGGVS